MRWKYFLITLPLLFALLLGLGGCTVLAVAGAATAVVVGVGGAVVSTAAGAVGVAADAVSAGVHAVAGSDSSKK